MMRARMAAHWDMRLGCANVLSCLTRDAAAEFLIQQLTLRVFLDGASAGVNV